MSELFRELRLWIFVEFYKRKVEKRGLDWLIDAGRQTWFYTLQGQV